MYKLPKEFADYCVFDERESKNAYDEKAKSKVIKQDQLIKQKMCLNLISSKPLRKGKIMMMMKFSLQVTCLQKNTKTKAKKSEVHIS